LFFQSASSDAAAILPTASLGNYYRVSGYRQYGSSNATYSVLAVEDDTVVTLTPKYPIIARNQSIPAGGNVSFTLRRGEVYTFSSQSGGSIDQTGSQLHGNKPFAAFVTHNVTNVPYKVCCGDQLSEQLP